MCAFRVIKVNGLDVDAHRGLSTATKPEDTSHVLQNKGLALKRLYLCFWDHLTQWTEC